MDKIIFFKISGFNLWNGGLNYLKQLKKNLKNESIDVVIIINDFDLIGIKKLEENSIHYKKIITKKYFRFFNLFLLKIGLSFSILKPHKKSNSKVKVFYHGLIPVRYLFTKNILIYWLPDILHEIYPKNFSKFHYYKRYLFTIINLKLTNQILLSSHSIKNQLKKRYRISKKIFIYQFSSFAPLVSHFNINFTKPVVLFPHEFWTHKRQEKIIELANNNDDYLFILTGNNRKNQRNSSFSKFNIKLKFLKNNNLLNLGEVDWKFLIELYSHADYIGNVSDYEGWNTSVEMAKSLNKKLILSKIDVHIEQTLNYNKVIWHDSSIKLPRFINNNPEYSYNKEFSERLNLFCLELFSE